MIGVGGSGMSAAATLLLRLGAEVTGSDRQTFDGLGDLVECGAAVFVGHAIEHLSPSTDCVVVSAAIPEDNAEWVEARRRGLRVLRYAELLGELMRDRRGVAVAGTHGKSTTTALLAHVFRTAGLDPSFVMGARSDQLGGSSGVGAGAHLIVEACEFARSFLALRPSVAGVLNIDADHLDCYDDLTDIRAAFSAFGAGVVPGGLLVTPHTERQVGEAATARGVRHETFGLESGANWRATNLRSDRGRFAFDVLYDGRRVLSAQLRSPGRHHVGNALIVAALACHEGVASGVVAEAMASFRGIQRRMDRRDAGGRVTVIDDYAHHPTEIEATLEALNDHYRPRKTWVVFQPHQASRTRRMMHQFARSFAGADRVIVADIYSVRDSAEDQAHTSSSDLASLIEASGREARYIGPLAEVARHVEENVQDGDLVVTMGAGDVGKVADELAGRISGSH